MPVTTRRTFMTWLGAVGAALRLRPASAEGAWPSLPAPSLDVERLSALGSVVLPSELGADGTARVVRGFDAWLRNYGPGAEVLHPYGNGTLGALPGAPTARWASQLDALDTAARSAHGVGFARASMTQREALVRAALQDVRGPGMPTPLTASHVALALLSWFYTSSEATDLCYGAKIGKNQCRPLVNNPKVPAPLTTIGRRTGPS